MPSPRAMIPLLMVGLLSIALLGADNPKEAVENTTPFTLADRLQMRIAIQNEFTETPLSEVLEFLNTRYELNLQVDAQFTGSSFASRDLDRKFVNLAPENPILQELVTLRKMKSVRLETVLNLICNQIHGTYLIYADRIVLVNRDALAGIIGQGEEEPPLVTLPLVTMKFESKSLAQTFNEISERTNTTILLAPQVAEVAKATISAKLINTPIDRAISLLAEMGELRMVRKGNAYLVTSIDRAKAIEPRMPNCEGNGLLPGDLAAVYGAEFLRGGSSPQGKNDTSQKIDELSRKITELEKKLGEKK